MRDKQKQILIIFVAILLFASMFGKQYKEYFNATEFNIKFMSKYETHYYINNDFDDFIKNIPDTEKHYDIYGNIDLDDYRTISAKSAVSFNDYEMKQITILAMAIDEFLIENFDLQQPRPSNVKWILALTNGTAYEEGRPHVRNDIIFLSTETIQKEINDQCQFGFTLLYLRQNIMFGKQVNTSAMPWNAQDINWKFANKLPTCQFYNKINYYNLVYDSTYDNEYMLSGSNVSTDLDKDQNLKLIAKRNEKDYYMNNTEYSILFY